MKITALLSALNSALAEPFALAWVSDSPRFLLVFTVIYAVVVIVAVTDQKNTRPGAEHGSAAWGDVFRLNKFYMDRHGSNLLLTVIDISQRPKQDDFVRTVEFYFAFCHSF